MNKRKVKVGLAQISASENKEKNVEKGIDYLFEASKNDVDIVCFPEMGFQRFFPQFPANPELFETAEFIPGPTTEKFSKVAQELNLIVILNIFEKDGKGRFFNSSPVINRAGEVTGISRMIHIAEEPFFYEKYYYHPGTGGFPVYDTDVCTFGIAICYDRHYPEQMRILTLKGAEIIFIPQAGIKENPIRFYEIEMQSCSFSNQIFTVLVNRVGKEGGTEFAGGSFITAPSGELMVRAGDSHEEFVIAELDLSEIEKLRIERPFLRDRRPNLYEELSKL